MNHSLLLQLTSWNNCAMEVDMNLSQDESNWAWSENHYTEHMHAVTLTSTIHTHSGFRLHLTLSNYCCLHHTFDTSLTLKEIKSSVSACLHCSCFCAFWLTLCVGMQYHHDYRKQYKGWRCYIFCRATISGTFSEHIFPLESFICGYKWILLFSSVTSELQGPQFDPEHRLL